MSTDLGAGTRALLCGNRDDGVVSDHRSDALPTHCRRRRPEKHHAFCPSLPKFPDGDHDKSKGDLIGFNESNEAQS